MTGGGIRARLAALLVMVPVLAGVAALPPAVAQEQEDPEQQARQPNIACAVPEPAEAPAEPPPGLAPAHRIATGAGVRVAVVDTGVSDHPQLGGVVPGGDLVSPQLPEPLLDCDGHGTVVAGVIAARDSGIAPDATVISVRQSSAHYRQPASRDTTQGGEATTGTLASLAEAVHLALDAGAQVINVSVVSCVPAELAARLDTGPLEEALARAEADGAVVVTAAGNQSRTCGPGAVVYPAHAPTVLSVAAVDPAVPHTLAGYSMPVGDTASALAAPGTAPVGLSPDGNGWAAGMQGADAGEVIPFAGTSFAAPVVSGTVALLRERHPQESAAQLRERVRGAAEPGPGIVDPYSTLTHLAADFTVAAREKEIAAAPAPDERARRVFLRVVGGLGLLVLAGVMVAGLFPRRVPSLRPRPSRRR